MFRWDAASWEALFDVSLGGGWLGSLQGGRGTPSMQALRRHGLQVRDLNGGEAQSDENANESYILSQPTFPSRLRSHDVR